MTNPKKEFYFYIFVIIMLLLEAGLFFVGKHEVDLVIKREKVVQEEIKNIFDNAPIEAKAFSIYNKTLNKKIYGKNDHIDMPLASISKVMTVAVALNENKYKDGIIYINKNAIDQIGDFGLFLNEKFNIKDLAQMTLIASANDAAFALTQNKDDFLIKMNDKARRIGMENTAFFNFTGLDIDDKLAGAYSSALDVNKMILYAYEAHPDIFGNSTLPEVKIVSDSGFEHDVKNTNTILNKIPNILFSKTGFTTLAGGNLSIIFKDKYNQIIAITVLGSSMNGRFTDMEKIVNILSSL